MPKGKYPIEYFENPNINKNIEEIYRDIDAYSGEFFEDEEFFKKRTDFFVILPPLKYENITTKGIFMSQGVDYIYKLFPDINKIFYSMAYTMWSSYPWSKRADVYLTCYKNEKREEFYYREHPEKKIKYFFRCKMLILRMNILWHRLLILQKRLICFLFQE